MSLRLRQCYMRPVTIAFYCVFIVALLPYLCVAYAKSSRSYLSGGNRAPRQFAEQLEGARKRAYWAQQNGFEAFPIFAAVVIIGALVGRAGQTSDILAVAFVGCRIVYSIFYVADRPTLRSMAWFGALLCELLMIGFIVT